MSDYIIEKRLPDGSYDRFDMALRSKIYHIKTELLEYVPSEPIKHPILGKEFLLHDQIVTIVKVMKDWQAGFFYAAIYEDEAGSHGVTYFENINSIAQHVLNAIESFRENFKPV